MPTEETDAVLKELQSVDLVKLRRLNLPSLTSVIESATEEIQWMKHALQEIADLTYPLMQPGDGSPIDVIKRLIATRPDS
jgi:hypothetical protein